MLLQELQSKDVVNVVDGSKLGRICDVDLESATGKITAITIQPNTRFIGLFSGNKNIVVPWNQIVKIGGEVIIVNYSNY